MFTSKTEALAYAKQLAEEFVADFVTEGPAPTIREFPNGYEVVTEYPMVGAPQVFVVRESIRPQGVPAVWAVCERDPEGEAWCHPAPGVCFEY